MIKLKPEFADRAKAFMAATCHLNKCQFPDCIGISNICNTHGEAVAGLFAEHARRVSELLEANNREVERRRKVEASLERIVGVLRSLIADSTDPGTEALAAVFEAGQVIDHG